MTGSQNATARVYRIDPGSVVVIQGVEPRPGMVEQLSAAIAERVGHSQFLVLVLPADGHAEVIPAGQLVGWLEGQGVILADTGDGPQLTTDRQGVPSGTDD